MKRRLNKITIMLLAVALGCASVSAGATGARFAKKDKTAKLKAEKPKEEEQVSSYVQKIGYLGRRYVFGVGISHSDSVTMVTMVCPVDGMAYDQGTNTPLGVDLYTETFRNFLEERGFKGYLCSTFIFSNEKQADRKLASICARATKRNRSRLVPADGFVFHRIDTEHIYTNAGENAGPANE